MAHRGWQPRKQQCPFCDGRFYPGAPMRSHWGGTKCPGMEGPAGNRSPKSQYRIGDVVESIAGVKGTVERKRTNAGDRSPGYYVRWENGSLSFARIGTVLKPPMEEAGK